MIYYLPHSARVAPSTARTGHSSWRQRWLFLPLGKLKPVEERRELDECECASCSTRDSVSWGFLWGCQQAKYGPKHRTLPAAHTAPITMSTATLSASCRVQPANQGHGLEGIRRASLPLLGVGVLGATPMARSGSTISRSSCEQNNAKSAAS